MKPGSDVGSIITLVRIASLVSIQSIVSAFIANSSTHPRLYSHNNQSRWSTALKTKIPNGANTAASTVTKVSPNSISQHSQN